ncbi:MAG: MipA/OmpV family protein [Desulfuromonadaceae bacterium]|nr:MipA/OmpV family protein [Desulfuromonadaceae bacterium]
MVARNCLSAIAALAFLLGAEAQAQDTNPAGAPTKPLWEVCVGGGVNYSPDYPAADKNSLHGLALPYVIYRGDFLRLGTDSIAKGIFINNDYTELDVSLAASFNANSNDNDARRGMPNLDYLFEMGPQLKIKFGKIYGGKTELQLPVRAVLSTDFSRFNHRGFLFNPKFVYERQNIFNSGVDMDSSIGSTFATKKLHEYFYRVEPRFATATRPAYEADGGYLGSKITLGLAYRITDRVRVYVGGQLGYYGGAANEDSPLFRQKVNSTVYAGVTWSIFQSDTRVISSE